ncbi:unnamed protein product [Effrenium voratum]|nr:unnamed protein product [Effrenium voratum]
MALSLRHALSARTAFRWDFSRWKASARGQGGYRAMALKVLPLVLALAPVTCLPTALVYESTTYLAQLSSAVAGKVGLRHCPCELSEDDREGVVAVVGMPRNITILKQLPQLKLVQSSSYMYPCLSTVPTQAAVAKIDVNWTSYGAEPIAEFVIAAVFHWSRDIFGPWILAVTFFFFFFGLFCRPLADDANPLVVEEARQRCCVGSGSESLRPLACFCKVPSL